MAEKASPSPSGSKEEKSNVWKKIAAGSLLAAVAFTGCSSNSAEANTPPPVTGGIPDGIRKTPTAHPETQTTSELWTLDDERFEEYKNSLMNLEEWREYNKIPSGQSSMDLARGFTRVMSNIENFGADPELVAMFEGAEGDVNISLMNAARKESVSEVNKLNNGLGGLLEEYTPEKGKAPQNTGQADEFVDILTKANKTNLLQYTEDPTSPLAEYTPVATLEKNGGNDRLIIILYSKNGGVANTELTNGEFTVKDVGVGDGMVEIRVNEDSEFAQITHLEFYGVVFDTSAKWEY